MTLGKMTLFILADGKSIEGTPICRIHGERVPLDQSIEPVRNATGVIDLRARPRWDVWSINLAIKFDTALFDPADIYNLLMRAGTQNGVGEGRMSSSRSNGMGWGVFEIDPSSPHHVEVLETRVINFQS